MPTGNSGRETRPANSHVANLDYSRSPSGTQYPRYQERAGMGRPSSLLNAMESQQKGGRDITLTALSEGARCPAGVGAEGRVRLHCSGVRTQAKQAELRRLCLRAAPSESTSFLLFFAQRKKKGTGMNPVPRGRTCFPPYLRGGGDRERASRTNTFRGGLTSGLHHLEGSTGRIRTHRGGRVFGHRGPSAPTVRSNHRRNRWIG